MNDVEALAKRTEWLNRKALDTYEHAMGRYAVTTDAAVISDLVPTGHGIALDLPCGTGRFQELLSARGYTIVAADLSPSMLSLTATRKKCIGLVRCDAAQLPFDENAFDLVLCMRLLFHYRQSDVILQQLVRVTRPGGVIIFDTLNTYSTRYAIEMFLNCVRRSPGHRIWFTSYKTWCAHVHNLGCEVVHTSTRYFLPTRAYRIVPSQLIPLVRKLDSLCPPCVRVVRYWKVVKTG